MNGRTLINGQQDSGVPADDRGLAYGDGLFETIAWREGKCRFWTTHQARLLAGCERLGIPPPESGLLEAEIATVCRGLESATVKVIWTRGGGQRGYAPPQEAQPNRVVTASATSSIVPQNWGIRVDWSDYPLPEDPTLAGLKHLNRLPQVLARRECAERRLDECLGTLSDGTVIGGSMSNLFILSGDEWLTPELERAGIAGCMRAKVMELADITVREARLDKTMVEGADALVLTNSLRGLMPVAQLGRHPLDRNTRSDNLLRRMAELGVSECADWL